MRTNQLSVLHVEDDPNDVLLLDRAFKKTNPLVTLQSVPDGDKAVAYLKGTNGFENREKFPIPNLVLLDLKMPRKSGMEVLAWIRSQPQLKRLVVIIFTSSKHDQDINQAYELGANSYLVQPVGFDALLGLVKMVNQYWGEFNQSATV